MGKAVFFDRDGTLIVEAHYLDRLDQVKLFETAGPALLRLKEAGYLLLMVTNQSGVARGYFPESFVAEANQELNRQLAAFGVALDGAAYCPHHLKGEPPYNVDCDCRKPKTGMIEQLCRQFEVDREGSWVVGDKLCDVELGYNAQMRSAVVLTGHGAKEQPGVQQRFPNTPILADLAAVAELILRS